MKYNILILAISVTTVVFAQDSDQIYLTHDYSNDGNGYNICEIVVHVDSSYTFKKYKVAKRKDPKLYKSSTPHISFGKIKKEGNYYIHTAYSNGKPTSNYLVSRFTNNRIILYKEHDDGYLERLENYKLIETK
nr:hypothetical protein [uncultured Psychroserpens sp.]